MQKSQHFSFSPPVPAAGVLPDEGASAPRAHLRGRRSRPAAEIICSYFAFILQKEMTFQECSTHCSPFNYSCKNMKPPLQCPLFSNRVSVQCNALWESGRHTAAANEIRAQTCLCGALDKKVRESPCKGGTSWKSCCRRTLPHSITVIITLKCPVTPSVKAGLPQRF